MNIIFLLYLITAYIFSGFICWLAILKNCNRRFPPPRWQCPLIVTFWPIWILVEIKS